MCKIPKIKKFSPIEVIWIDAEYSTDRGWYNLEQYENWINTQKYFKQCGYFVEFTKDYVSMCSGFGASGDNHVNNTSGLNIIPIGCIKRIRVLR